MLIIFGGLPGVGKTTLSRRLAQVIGAVYLRIDTIEAAIKTSCLRVKTAENAGYLVGYALAKDNLLIGHKVVADSVNSLPLTREAWQEVSVSAGKEFLEIEVICSDKAEHKRRIESRTSDLKGLVVPTWEEVQKHPYSAWHLQGLRIDTARCTLEQNIAEILKTISQRFSLSNGS